MINGFCRYITKLSLLSYKEIIRKLSKLIVKYGLIDHEFCYQFSKFMLFQTLEKALVNKRCIALTIWLN